MKKWSESRAAALKKDTGVSRYICPSVRLYVWGHLISIEPLEPQKSAPTDVRNFCPCVLQDIGPLGPLPCSHSTSSADHSKQGIGYR